ncbi:MAG TPA: hypothetical protein VF240_04320 [Pyrinomonadaceae bacterium]
MKKESGAEVEMSRGGLGELSVCIDGRKVVETRRFWFASPGSVVSRVRAALDGRDDG